MKVRKNLEELKAVCLNENQKKKMLLYLKCFPSIRECAAA